MKEIKMLHIFFLLFNFSDKNNECKKKINRNVYIFSYLRDQNNKFM